MLGFYTNRPRAKRLYNNRRFKDIGIIIAIIINKWGLSRDNEELWS